MLEVTCHLLFLREQRVSGKTNPGDAAAIAFWGYTRVYSLSGYH